MKLKRIMIGTLSLTMITTMVYGVSNVEAVDFSKDESKYMTLCSSSNLSSSNKSTCEEFNKYLKKKNQELNSQLASQKETASNTEDTLDDISSKLNSLKNDISTKESEISYVETTIANTEAQIAQNDQEIKDRMYSMQSYLNEDTYINYIFGASSFSDMLSRIDSYNELTSSDQDLIEQMIEQKKEVQKQKEVLEVAKTALLAQKEQQTVLQTQYTAKLEEQKKQIAATQDAIYDYGAATETLSAAIDKFNAEAYETPVTNSKPVPPTTPSTPNTNTNTGTGTGSSNNDSNNNNTNNDNTNNNTNNNTNTSSTLGYNIYKIAYGKLGSRYYWGAQGPTYFDCSGLVYYCLKNAGVNTYRTTAAEYSRKWTSVSWSNSQTGDLVCFGSPAYHIGIVILNADGTRSVIHAGGGDSHTFGDNPNACVKISSLQPGSYYYGKMTTIRHVS